MSEEQNTQIKVSVFTVIKVVLILVGLYLLYRILDIVAILFIAVILAALIDPFATWLQKNKIPRGVAVLIIYVVLLGLLSLVLVLLIPPLLSEMADLVKNFGGIWDRVTSAFASFKEITVQYGIEENIQRGLQSLEQGFYDTIGGAVGTIRGFFGGLMSLLFILILTFYLVVDEEGVKKFVKSVAPDEYHPYIAGLFNRVQIKISQWLRGELILMFIVGLFSYIGLLILGVDFALILGIFSGLTEIIPYAGPIIGAVPAIIIAFTQSPMKALFVAILYFAIQQLENNLLVPKVMQRAVGLNPIVSIVALLIGARFGGIVGALLAIPVATVVSVFVQDLFHDKEKLKEV